MVAGIDLGKAPFDAWHELALADDAEMLAWTHAVNETPRPLVARRQVGKGRVVCMTHAPKGNLLVKGIADPSNPLWPAEAVLYDRALRWALDADLLDADEEQALMANYSQIVDAPAPVPSEVIGLEYPYVGHSLCGVFPDNFDRMLFKWYAETNFNHIILQDFMVGGSEPFDDRLTRTDRIIARYNRALAAENMFCIARPWMANTPRDKGHAPEEYAVKCLPGGEIAQHYGEPNPCPHSPLVLKYADERSKQFMGVLKKYDHFTGMFCEDEWAWVVGYRNPYEQAPGLGSYSPWANEKFLKATHIEPPAPQWHDWGYVFPENDPWLKWCQVIRQDAYADYNQILMDNAQKHRPGFLVSNYPGGFEGNTNVMVEEVYLDCWRSSELLTLERMDIRYNFREDYTGDRHPLWALIGVFRMPEDKSMYPETLRLTVGMCLGSAARGMILWNTANLFAPYMQHPGRVSLDIEARRLGAMLKRYGPMFANLKRSQRPVWMSSGWFWHNTWDNQFLVPPPEDHALWPNKERAWWMWQITDIAGPAAMRAGLPIEYVTEKQLASDRIFQQDAVILPGLVYCRQGVVDNLEAYIRKGGKVFMDASAKVRIKGATTLPIDLSEWHKVVAEGKRPTATPTEKNYRAQVAMRNGYTDKAIDVFRTHITDKISPDVRIMDNDAACTYLHHGQATYLFVYNTDVDAPNSFEVSYRHMPGVAYDVFDQKIVSNSRQPEGTFAVSLPAGGWKVYALSPAVVNTVQIRSAGLSGRQLTLDVELRDTDDRIFDACVPLSVTLTGKDGQRFTLHTATSNGRARVQIPCRGAIPVPDTITVTELFLGKTARAKPGNT